MPERRHGRTTLALVRLGLVLASLLAGVVLLRLAGPDPRAWVTGLFALAERHAASPVGAATVLAAFVAGAFVLMPIPAMIMLTAAAVGPRLGFAYTARPATA